MSEVSHLDPLSVGPSRLKRLRVQIAAIVILLLGLLQMVGDLFGVAEVKGVGAASMASPAPKVFSSVKGLETFSTRIYLEWTSIDGGEQSIEFDRDSYANLQGPYNRRNIYGAALAYGPVLAQDERARRQHAVRSPAHPGPRAAALQGRRAGLRARLEIRERANF